MFNKGDIVNIKLRLLLASAVALTLSGCGGGGGSSTTLSNLTVSFSENQTLPRSVSLSDGHGVETNYTWDSQNDKIASIGTAKFNDKTTLNATFDANSNYGTAGFTNTDSTLTFDTNDTYGTFSLDSDYLAVEKDNGQDYLVLANPYKLNFDYQTFGTWATGGGTGSGEVGGLSNGFRTLHSSIPTSGVATYTGEAGGRWVEKVDVSGDYGWIKADLTATANFSNRQISVATSNSVRIDQKGRTDGAGFNSAYDFNGTLSYNDVNNHFQGNISNGGDLTGTAQGQFYGPNAEEMGGVFSLDSDGTIAGYMGGFGAKR